jgi:hypothetical protein
MSGRRLILAAGSDAEVLLEGSEAGYADGVLWLYLAGVTLPEAFALLTAPENTGVIAYQYGEMEDRYGGFTDLTGLFTSDGMVRAALTREAI